MMFYDYFDTGLIGCLTLVGDADGLRHIDFEKERSPLTIEAAWQRNPDHFAPLKQQLEAYFRGDLQRFDPALPLAPRGTDFQLKVWRALQKIPYGEVASYLDVARAIGNPKAVRAVGGANARNPIPIIIPCHRVIGSDGSLTGFGGGLTTKQRLLDLERGRELTIDG